MIDLEDGEIIDNSINNAGVGLAPPDSLDSPDSSVESAPDLEGPEPGPEPDDDDIPPTTQYDSEEFPRETQY